MPKPCDISPEIIGRFRAFLAERGHVARWSDNVLWLALRIVERRRGEGPGHPYRGNQYTGGISGPKLAPDKGGNGNGNGKNSAPKAITKKDAKRDFSKRGGETKRDFFYRVGQNMAQHLQAAGLPVTINQALQTDSVYLKGQGFEVRIADHVSRRGERPADEHLLLIKGSGLSARAINGLLAEIHERHKP